MFTFFWLEFFMVIAICVADNPCDNEKDVTIDFEVVNLTSEFTVTVWNITHPVSYNLSIVYTWDLSHREETAFDGFLYKQTDFEQHFKYFSSPLDDENPPINTCNKTGGNKLWAVVQNGSSYECQIPCSEYFPPPCASNEVCNRLNEDGFLSLPRNTNRLEVKAEFGRLYETEILLYYQWNIVKKYDFNQKKLIRFCRDELIERHGYSPDAVNEYCSHNQKIADSHYSTGPPSNFEKASIGYDLASNRGKAVFRWKAPLDISPNVQLVRFLIYLDGGDIESLFVYADEHDDGFYHIEVTNIKLNATNHIKITPFTNKLVQRKIDFSKYGFPISMNYVIEDIDACEEPHRYCDEHAYCEDLSSDNDMAAVCECHDGYYGDGIKDVGTGCTEYDACSANQSLCAENADCVDLAPPSMEANCSCREHYIGDGYKNGTKCTMLWKKILPILFPILSIAIVAVVIGLIRRRFKISRKRSAEKSMSAFMVDPYQHSHYILGNEKLVGRFGEKYEIDRKHVTLTRVIGRGNFGVVHEATLKLEDDLKKVAVKTTLEPHTEESEQEFLAEICLILSIGEHKNILGMIGCCTADQSNTYLITTFMKYGDLKNFLWDARELKKRQEDPIYNITEQDIYCIGHQVAKGLEYLTGLRFIHGDIAARNILVDEGLQCKISDFGLANDVYRYGNIQGAREKRVPMKWISPERMLAGKIPVTWRSDVWSFGILLYESVTLGASPYPGVSTEDLLEFLRTGCRMDKPRFCSQYLYDVMLKCWRWTPSERPTFKELQFMMKKGLAGIKEENYIKAFVSSDSGCEDHLL